MEQILLPKFVFQTISHLTTIFVLTSLSLERRICFIFTIFPNNSEMGSFSLSAHTTTSCHYQATFLFTSLKLSISRSCFFVCFYEHLKPSHRETVVCTKLQLACFSFPLLQSCLLPSALQSIFGSIVFTSSYPSRTHTHVQTDRQAEKHTISMHFLILFFIFFGSFFIFFFAG